MAGCLKWALHKRVAKGGAKSDMGDGHLKMNIFVWRYAGIRII